MSNKLIAKNGGSEIVTFGSSAPQGVFLSPQYTAVNNLTPRTTEWNSSGRPIYDRLPGVSERYRLDYPYEDTVAYTYIPNGEGYTGRVSMAVQASGDNKYLVIQAGQIVWKYGTLVTEPVIIDLELIGMGSAKYLLAYQMYYDDSPQPFEYGVSDFSIAGKELKIESSTDEITGWRYTSDLSLSERDNLFWANQDPLFPEEIQEAFLSWESKLSSSLSGITLRVPANKKTYQGTATLYYMLCGEPGEDGFCETPSWEFCAVSEVTEDDLGQLFNFEFSEPVSSRGWRVEWSDKNISINSITVSGVVTETLRPATATTSYGLVAYPLNSIPSTFTNSAGEEVPLTLCKLAHVDIDSSFTVLDIKDIREVVSKSYEPISEWLTRFWDENLIKHFFTLKSFSEKWMNPPSCMEEEYGSLIESDIILTQSECN